MQFSCHLHSLLLCSDGNKSMTWDKAASAWRTLGTDPSCQLPLWKSTPNRFQMENGTLSPAKMRKRELVGACLWHRGLLQGYRSRLCSGSQASKVPQNSCQERCLHGNVGTPHACKWAPAWCISLCCMLQCKLKPPKMALDLNSKWPMTWLLFVSPKITVNGLYIELSYIYVKVNWGNCLIYFGSKSRPLEGVSWSGIGFLRGFRKCWCPIQSCTIRLKFEVWYYFLGHFSADKKVLDYALNWGWHILYFWLCICIDSLGPQGRLADNSVITGRQTLSKHQITVQPNQNQGHEAAHKTWGTHTAIAHDNEGKGTIPYS